MRRYLFFCQVTKHPTESVLLDKMLANKKRKATKSYFPINIFWKKKFIPQKRLIFFDL